jgi:hypothetical protein
MLIALALFLSLIFVFAFVPNSSNVAYAETVSTVDISNVQKALIGNEMFFEVSWLKVPEGAVYSVQSVEWWNVTDATPVQCELGDTFLADNNYEVRITIALEEGGGHTFDTSVVATINGTTPADFLDNYDDTAVVSHDFGTAVAPSPLTITFVPGTGGGTQYTKTAYEERMFYDFDPPTDFDPPATPANSAFKGWTVPLPGYNTKPITPGGGKWVIFPSDTTVTAHWEEQYKVTVTNGKVEGENFKYYFAGTKDISILANDREAEGLVFNNWSVSPDTVMISSPNEASTKFGMPDTLTSGTTIEFTAHYSFKIYQVMYSSGSSTDPAPSNGEKTHGQEFTTFAACSLTRGGYVHVGWKRDGESEVPSSAINKIEANVNQDVKLYPVWSKKHAITCQNCTSDQDPPVAIEGTAVTVTANTPGGGERFDGWEVTPSSVIIAPVSDQPLKGTFNMPSSDVTVRAKYKNVYYVEVINGTGDGDYAQGDTVTIVADDPGAGRRFTGWVTTPFNVVEIVPAGADKPLEATFVMTNQTIKVEPRYENVYNITVTNGTCDKNPAVAAKNEPVTITANDPGANQRFTGWTVLPDTVVLSTDGLNPLKATFTMIEEEVTATANYATEYTVTLSIAGENEYKKYIENEIVNLAAEEEEIYSEDKGNWRFSYWKITGDETIEITNKTSYTGASFKMPAKNITVQGNYVKIYLVTVVGGEGGGYYASNDFDPTYTPDTVNIQANAPQDGQRFKNWTIEGEGVTLGSATSASTSFTMPGNAVTVTANYEYIYTITINGGTCNKNPMVAAENERVNIYANDPAEGYEFVNWTIDFGDFVFGAPNSADTFFDMPASRAEVTANYKKITYAITYNKGAFEGVTGDLPENEVKTYGEDYAVSTTYLTRTGYTQIGWKVGVESTDGQGAVSTLQTNAVATLYPVWKINTYTIKWLKEDGTLVKTDTVNYNVKPVFVGVAPTKEADNTYTYTFKDWGNVVNAVANAEYRAVYTKIFINYTVTFKDGDEVLSTKADYHYGDEVVVPNVSEKEGYKFKGWAPEFSETCNGNAEYATVFLKTYTFAVSGNATESGSDEVPETVVDGDEVTVTAAAAPEGKEFAGWYVNGELVSTNPTYKYTFNPDDGDVVLEARYEDITVAPSPEVITSNKKNLGAGAIAGIVIAGLAVLGVAIFFIVRKKKQ